MHDVLHIALKDLAKGFNCMGADAFVSLKSGNLCRTDVEGFNKGVLAYALFFHRLP